MYDFSACGKTREIGPNQTEADNCYSSTNLKVKIIGEGIQKWIVPQKGRYLITAAGASGTFTCDNRAGGAGVKYASLFNLNKNDILYILVGQQGYSSIMNIGGSGGGASYVVKKVEKSEYNFSLDNANVMPLLVAAGGGGAGDCNDPGSPKNGEDGHCENMDDEGGETKETKSSGGAGFSFNSKIGNTKSFINGGTASYVFFWNTCYAYGAFGGGGNAENGGGGGGGFRGGASGELGVRGFGGYSYNVGKKTMCVSNNFGSGYVTLVQVGGNNVCTKRYVHSSPGMFLYILLTYK